MSKKTTINDVIRECSMQVIDATGKQEQTEVATFSTDLPVLSHRDAQVAAGAADGIRDKYQISEEDMDILFNTMLIVFIRGEYCLARGYEPDGREGN